MGIKNIIFLFLERKHSNDYNKKLRQLSGFPGGPKQCVRMPLDVKDISVHVHLASAVSDLAN